MGGIGELSKELVAGASEHGCEAKWFPGKADFLAEMKHLIQPGGQYPCAEVFTWYAVP